MKIHIRAFRTLALSKQTNVASAHTCQGFPQIKFNFVNRPTVKRIQIIQLFNRRADSSRLIRSNNDQDLFFRQINLFGWKLFQASRHVIFIVLCLGLRTRDSTHSKLMRLVNLKIVLSGNIHLCGCDLGECGIPKYGKWIALVSCGIYELWQIAKWDPFTIKIKIYKLIICVEFNKIEFKSKICCFHRARHTQATAYGIWTGTLPNRPGSLWARIFLSSSVVIFINYTKYSFDVAKLWTRMCVDRRHVTRAQPDTFHHITNKTRNEIAEAHQLTCTLRFYFMFRLYRWRRRRMAKVLLFASFGWKSIIFAQIM